jgi:nucleoside-diphosphate-sugar epimerase
VVQERVGKAERLLITGAGGFIGHHLVKYLVAKGYWVRGADIKHPTTNSLRRTSFKSSIYATPKLASLRPATLGKSTTWQPTWVGSAT